jgi:hypothetical protein
MREAGRIVPITVTLAVGVNGDGGREVCQRRSKDASALEGSHLRAD